MRVDFYDLIDSFGPFQAFLNDEILIKSNLPTGCPRQNATDLEISNGNRLIFIIERLFPLKSARITVNFDIFFPYFWELGCKVKNH